MTFADQRDYGYAHPQGIAGSCSAIIRIGIQSNVHLAVQLQVFNGRFKATDIQPVSRDSQSLEPAEVIVPYLPVITCSELQQNGNQYWP